MFDGDAFRFAEPVRSSIVGPATDPATADRTAVRMIAFVDQMLARHQIQDGTLSRVCTCGRWGCDVRDLARACQLIP